MWKAPGLSVQTSLSFITYLLFCSSISFELFCLFSVMKLSVISFFKELFVVLKGVEPSSFHFQVVYATITPQDFHIEEPFL